MTAWLAVVDHSVAYRAAVLFYGLYPMLMALVWIVMSVAFRLRQERRAPDAPWDYAPFVSVIVPAFAEEATIAATLEALLAVEYPAFEVIVVSDGSPDGTVRAARPFVRRGPVRLLVKSANEGKAMALNDALPLCRGEIVVVVDADIRVTPGVLRALVPHFAAPRVGAVTGNPRVANRESLLQRLQALEFTSIVSVQRRAQRVWGRVLTVSGAVFAVRRSALVEVGLFAPGMATEDIDLTWRLQRRFWDVRYEPRAVVWMQVPPTLRELWKQRRRWARGLAQVLRRHRGVWVDWRCRRLWPVFVEAVASIAWAYSFVFLTAFWAVSFAVGYEPFGASPVPNLWGMMVGTACLTQLAVGVALDARYDPGLRRCFAVAVLYPLVYWMLMSVITVVYTVEVFVTRPRRLETWAIRRV